MLSLKNFLGVLALMLVVACGGGGGNSGSSPFNSGIGGVTGTTENAATSSAGTILMSLSTNQISSSSPGLVSVSVRDSNGAAVSGVVDFEVLNASLAGVNPASVLLVNGLAQATILPATSAANGATYVTATIEIGTSTLTARVPFSVSPTTVALTSASADSSTLSAYASTGVSFVVSGASATSPVTIQATSTCANQSKATISPQTQTLTSTTGSITYQDKGCGATDLIVIRIDGTNQSQTVTLNVAAPVTRGIEFVSATPDKICIFGSGCTETSEVVFKVTDNTGKAQEGTDVVFSLDQPDSAELVSLSGRSITGGLVSAFVKSKAKPGPVRVKAVTVANPVGATTFQTVSSALAVNSGLPRQNGVSFSASKFALNANLFGDQAALSIRLNDRAGNPVPDGTVVSLVAEGGTVVPASCKTVASECSVALIVSNPQPGNGRVDVVAYAQGEESFEDAGINNSLYDSGEVHDDLGPVVLDKNENGVMDLSAGERIIGADANGVWDSNTYVRSSLRFYFSITASAPRLFEVTTGTGGVPVCTFTPYVSRNFNLGATGGCRAQAEFCMRDSNTLADSLGGNPVASGSTLILATKADGATVTVDNSPIPSAISGPTFHVITAERSKCSEPPESSGAIDFSITMGGGSGTKFTRSIGNVTLN